MNTQIKTISAYIKSFPKDTQRHLQAIHDTIRTAAPQAEEAISYGMPTFKLHGNLVHFAAFAKHFGFYPAASGVAKFQKELKRFKTSKGAIQFPVGEPLPLALIRKIVLFRVKDNLHAHKTKQSSV